MSSKISWLLTITMAALLAVAACGGHGGKEPEVTPTIAATVAATGEPTEAGSGTGDPALDAIVEALQSRNAEALQPLIAYTKVPCSAEGQVITGRAGCAPDEAEGTLIDVFQYGVCHGADLRPNEIDQALTRMAASDLFGVYRAPQGGPFYTDTEYVAIISDPASDPEGLASEVLIRQGRIVGLRFSCATTAGEMVRSRGLTQAVLLFGSTGIADLDPVIDALLSGEPAAVRQLIEFTKLPCNAPPPGPEYGPLCEANEQDGELIGVFYELDCDGGYARPQDVERIATDLAASTLYAVYRVPPDYGFSDASYADLGFPPEYVAVLSHPVGNIPDAASEVVIRNGRIIADHFSCTEPVRDFVQQRGLTGAVLPPPAE